MTSHPDTDSEYHVELSVAVRHGGRRFTIHQPGSLPAESDDQRTLHIQAETAEQALQKVEVNVFAVVAAAQTRGDDAKWIKRMVQFASARRGQPVPFAHDHFDS